MTVAWTSSARIWRREEVRAWQRDKEGVQGIREGRERGVETRKGRGRSVRNEGSKGSQEIRG